MQTMQMTRRGALAGTVAACLAAGAAGAVAVAEMHPDAELLALDQELSRVREAEYALSGEELERRIDDFTDAGSRIAKRMVEIRARTIDGFHAKARAFAWCAGEIPETNYFGDTTEAGVAMSIIRDLMAA